MEGGAMMKRWCLTEDECLRREWLAGTPVLDIAVKMGRPKNSIIGRACRLGLPLHVYVTNKAARRRADALPPLLTEEERRERHRELSRVSQARAYRKKYGVDAEWTERRRAYNRNWYASRKETSR